MLTSGRLARKSMTSRSSRGRIHSSAQRPDRAVLGDAPDERRRFFTGDSLHFRTGLLQDLDGTFCRQVGGDHDEDPEAGLGVFVVITANLTAERTVEILEKARAEMERVAGEEAPPFIWRVAKDGSVRPLS